MGNLFQAVKGGLSVYKSLKATKFPCHHVCLDKKVMTSRKSVVSLADTDSNASSSTPPQGYCKFKQEREHSNGRDLLEPECSKLMRKESFLSSLWKQNNALENNTISQCVNFVEREIYNQNKYEERWCSHSKKRSGGITQNKIHLKTVLKIPWISATNKSNESRGLPKCMDNISKRQFIVWQKQSCTHET